MTAARLNPFTYAVELVRFALYGRLDGPAAAVVVAASAVLFLIAVPGYDPQRAVRKAPAL